MTSSAASGLGALRPPWGADSRNRPEVSSPRLADQYDLGESEEGAIGLLAGPSSSYLAPERPWNSPLCLAQALRLRWPRFFHRRHCRRSIPRRPGEVPPPQSAATAWMRHCALLLAGGWGGHPIGFGWARRSSLLDPNGGGRVCEVLEEEDELAGNWGRMRDGK